VGYVSGGARPAKLISTANVSILGTTGVVANSNRMKAIPPNPEQERRTLRQLYPHLSDSKVEEANENLKDYVAFALRVFERLELDPDAWARFEALTAARRKTRMNNERPLNNSPNL
jgi:hypothetical protein